MKKSFAYNFSYLIFTAGFQLEIKFQNKFSLFMIKISKIKVLNNVHIIYAKKKIENCKYELFLGNNLDRHRTNQNLPFNKNSLWYLKDLQFTIFNTKAFILKLYIM